MARFIIVLVAVTALIMATVEWGMSVHPSWYYQTVFLLFLSTVGLYYFLLRTRHQQPQNFIPVYLLTLVIKLLAYGIYVLLVVLSDENGAVMNATFFMITYFIYTGLEVSFLYRSINRESPEE